MTAGPPTFERLRELALAPPTAAARPLASAALRAVPEDFVVVETLGFAPDGAGSHWLLQVEKRGANTQFVARELARIAGVPPVDVGYAGLKDRHAVAVQWFSVPAARGPTDWDGIAGDGFRVVGGARHGRKLKRGALKGNRFRLRLTGLAGDVADLPERLERVARDGVPNYFGPQRFGRDASNLAQVAEWLAGGDLPPPNAGRGFVLSAARSVAFNAVLGARVADGSWQRLLDGEIVNLDGSGSVFAASVIDDVLAQRCADWDVHPTGPLPGSGGLQPTAAAAAAETAALTHLVPLVAALVDAGLEAERRPLRLRPRELHWQIDGDVLALEFALPRGSFATAVVRELVQARGDAPGDEA